MPGKQNGGVGRALQGRICVNHQLLPDRYGGNFPRWPCGWRGLSGGEGLRMTDHIQLAAQERAAWLAYITAIHTRQASAKLHRKWALARARLMVAQ